MTIQNTPKSSNEPESGLEYYNSNSMKSKQTPLLTKFWNIYITLLYITAPISFIGCCIYSTGLSNILKNTKPKIDIGDLQSTDTWQVFSWFLLPVVGFNLGSCWQFRHEFNVFKLKYTSLL